MSGLGCGCGGASAMPMAGLGLISDLGLPPFDYKGADCPTLSARIDRLKANMDSHPNRASDPKYKTNYANFTAEYQGRCGALNSSVGPMATAYQPSALPGMDTGSIMNAANPFLQSLLTQAASGDTNAQKQLQVMAQQQAQASEAPFYTQTWFKVAAGVAVLGLAFGIFKIAKRRRGK